MTLLDRFLESQTERTFGHGEPPWLDWTNCIQSVAICQIDRPYGAAESPYPYTNAMKSEDYAQGDAFQAEKRTVFSTRMAAALRRGQIAKPGDFLSATVGGWSVFGVRDKEGAVRVLRNACRHQNMQVVGTPSGNCESFRCRFHGWTYDLQGTVRGRAAAGRAQGSAIARSSSGVARRQHRLGHRLLQPRRAGRAARSRRPLPAYGGTLTTEIACNWKVCVEHLLAEHTPSADFAWHWPLLAVRRAGRGDDHGTGRAAHLPAHAASHPRVRRRTPTNTSRRPPPSSTSARRLQADRADGKPAAERRAGGDFPPPACRGLRAGPHDDLNSAARSLERRKIFRFALRPLMEVAQLLLHGAWCRRAQHRERSNPEVMPMSLQANVVASLPHVEADMNYLAPMARAAAQLHLRAAGRRAAQQHRPRRPPRRPSMMPVRSPTACRSTPTASPWSTIAAPCATSSTTRRCGASTTPRSSAC